jgi:hypothetical protein
LCRIERLIVVRTARSLSTFDRVGIAVVTALGTCIGLLAAVTGFGMTVPGILVGVGAAVSSGATGGFFLYAWDRFVNSLTDRLRAYHGRPSLE